MDLIRLGLSIVQYAISLDSNAVNVDEFTMNKHDQWWDEDHDEKYFILMYIMEYNLGPWSCLEKST